MEYSKKFLKEFKVDTGQTYIVVPVDGKLHEVPLSRKNTNKKYPTRCMPARQRWQHIQ